MGSPRAEGILAVATALPRRRVSGETLALRFGLNPARFASEFGLREKPVAVDGDEHPSDFATVATTRALEAAGASPDDVGLVIFAGVSHDYLPSFSVALEVIGRLGMKGAVGYDLSIGCAAPLAAMGNACARGDDGRPPLSVVVSAERWTSTISPDVPVPTALLGHADGGAACVIGPGASNELRGPPALLVHPQYNRYLFVPAGGTREPASADTLANKRHLRTAPSHQEARGELVKHYVASYQEVTRQALSRLSPDERGIELLLMNQVRPTMRTRIREALEVPPERAVNTYPALGHLGGADLFVGLEAHLRSGRSLRGTTVFAGSSVSTFGAIACVAKGSGQVAVPREPTGVEEAG